MPEDIALMHNDDDLVFVPVADATISIYMIGQATNDSRALGALFRAVVEKADEPGVLARGERRPKNPSA